jgi:hypothetical protein
LAFSLQEAKGREAVIDEQGEEDEDIEDDFEGRYGIALAAVDGCARVSENEDA